jgi:Rieske Fe-S protein
MPGDGFDRRSFVKACAGVGAGGAVTAAGFGMLQPVSDVGVEIVNISYPGMRVLPGSPAPYGLPLIPLEITDDGILRGRPDAAEDQLKWYKYCSHERAPGTFQGFESDNVLRYDVSEEKVAKGFDAWFTEHIDEEVHYSDFPKDTPDEQWEGYPGSGAAFRWRSEGVEPESKISGIIVRAPKEELGFMSTVPTPIADEIREGWFPEHPDDPDDIFMACCSFCTHFCCVPDFHTAELAISSGYGDTIFCTCHLSRYDPFQIETYNRTIFEYPDAGPGGGGGGGGGEGGGGH